MSHKTAKRERIDVRQDDERLKKFTAMLESEANDSWASVELYRWQHGELPSHESPQKKLDAPAAFRAMARAFLTPDTSTWPTGGNVASVLCYAARMLDSPKPEEPKNHE